MTPRITKKQLKLAEVFNARAAEIAKSEYLAVPVEDRFFPHLLMETTYGKMTIRVGTNAGSVLSFGHRRGEPKGSLYTVFCCFQENEHIKAAGQSLGSNPYSGKYNFHFSTDGKADDLEQALRGFRAHLQRVSAE